MAFDNKMRIFGAVLTIPAVLLAIGAGYERGGLAGLRDLAADTLHSVGLYNKAPAPSAALPATGARNPSSSLAPDEVFWLTIKDSRATGLFEEFLKKYPNSPHAQEAREKLQTLQAAQAATQQQPRSPMGQRNHGPGMMMRPGGGG
jgi:hypothetical protein